MPIIQSVQRSLKILDLFDEHTNELKITDISEKMGLHKSTVHSLLKTLQESGYIDQNPENGKYRLGLKLVERGNLVISTIDIRKIAKSYLLDLSKRTGQTTHLGILDGNAGVYIDKEEGEKSVIRYSRLGRRIPLHSTAIGKVLLSLQKPEVITQLLKDYEYTSSTKKTITNEMNLLEELEKVRQLGYAVDNQENEIGVRCIAVPIKNNNNQVLAAVSISTLVSSVNDQKLEEFIVLLKKVGHELSDHVRYGLPD
ncbi:IclR family transcriptional regulator [Metabacillus halosaccharovorans]|uniref:IclR family transcriptional regulator n=1 Tax=Metabacillus halosaccharovorans TaxID=930124 RepID=A0ABT3DNM7_9BACI|nr:IclR family transcriptional regulator [Metabacillus halosaccharovorans]MCV9888658.1 IclR family transcriptional regulator [Metabacillus halosaccharovorans]